MAVETLSAVAKLTEGITIDCSARNFKITMDEPEELGGANKGMNPIEAVLGSLGACQSIVAKLYAEAMGIDLQDWKIEVEGDIDLDGLAGVDGVPIGIQKIRTKIHIKSNSPKEKIEEFVKFVAKTCPVEDTIKRSPEIIPEIVIEK